MALMRGRIVSFDSPTYTASVRTDGSAPQRFDGVTVAANIASAEMVVGRRVLVDTGASGEVGELVVYGVLK